MQIYDAFGSRPGCGPARLPDGTPAVLVQGFFNSQQP